MKKLIALVILAVAVITLSLRYRSDSAENLPPVVSNRAPLTILPVPEITRRNTRVVYPYSVVPGGVTSGRELREFTVHDPIVLRHYSGFKYDKARIITVSEPRPVYVSYRIGGNIYWTRKPLMLHFHETLLTDGLIVARTRCGNQLSITPHPGEVSTKEPSVDQLDTIDPVASGTDTEASGNFKSVLNPVNTGIYGVYDPPGVSVLLPLPLPIGGGECKPKKGHKCKTEPKPPTEVPEPETLTLMLIGIASIVCYHFNKGGKIVQ